LGIAKLGKGTVRGSQILLFQIKDVGILHAKLAECVYIKYIPNLENKLLEIQIELISPIIIKVFIG
jgi:hypothetical protein